MRVITIITKHEIWLRQPIKKLVLLPIIMIGQNIQSKEQDRKAKIDFEINQKAEREIETMMEKLHLIHSDIKAENENK